MDEFKIILAMRGILTRHLGLRALVEDGSGYIPSQQTGQRLRDCIAWLNICTSFLASSCNDYNLYNLFLDTTKAMRAYKIKAGASDTPSRLAVEIPDSKLFMRAIFSFRFSFPPTDSQTA